MSKQGTAFYLNCEAFGTDVHTTIMKYYWKKKASVTRHSEDPYEKHSLKTQFMARAGTVMGEMHGHFSSSDQVGECFQEILADCTKKAMARLGYYCDVEGMFVNGKADQIFAAIRVSNLRVDKAHHGCCGSGCVVPVPSFLSKLCVCCPRTQLSCCAGCQFPLNVDAVAERVEAVLMDDNDATVMIPARIEGEVPSAQKLNLNRRGFYDVHLPDEFEVIAANTVKPGLLM